MGLDIYQDEKGNRFKMTPKDAEAAGYTPVTKIAESKARTASQNKAVSKPEPAKTTGSGTDANSSTSDQGEGK